MEAPQPNHSIKSAVISSMFTAAIVAGLAFYHFQAQIKELKGIAADAQKQVESYDQRLRTTSIANSSMVEVIDAHETVFEKPLEFLRSSKSTFYLKSAQLGKFRTTAERVPTTSLQKPFLPKGTEVYGIELAFDLTVDQTGCITNEIQLITEDTVVVPYHRQFFFPSSSGCVAQKGVVYHDLIMFFPIKEDLKSFQIKKELDVDYLRYDFSILPNKTISPILLSELDLN